MRLKNVATFYAITNYQLIECDASKDKCSYPFVTECCLHDDYAYYENALRIAQIITFARGKDANC